MKFIWINIIFLCMLCFTTCNRAKIKDRDQNTIFIDIDNLDKEAKKIKNLSDFVHNSKIIALETNDECLIGRINDIQIINDTIYILDENKARALFMFSINGNYLRKISRLGKGPGEFLSPSGFDVDSVNHEVMIYDRSSRKINIYNTSGKYLRNIKLKEYIIDFTYHKGYYYLYYNPRYAIGNKILHKINSTGKIIWSALDSKDFIKRNYITNLMNGNFYQINDKIIFWRNIHPVFFSIDNNEISPKFVLNTKNQITESGVKKLGPGHPKKAEMLNNIQGYSENIRYSLFNYYIGRKRFYVIYDKYNENLYYNDMFIKDDDLNNVPLSYLQILDDNTMLGIVTINNMMNFNKDLLKKLNIDENNNPILVLYNLSPV